MNRIKNREQALICIYQNMIYPRNLQELIEDTDSTDLLEDTYIQEVMRTAVDNAERYRYYANQVLEGWTFDRLGYVEQAIILCGCAEFDLKQIEAAVIIDEYIKLAKKYCDAESYKLINGVLDRI
ncbi:MAG: transcription antitermination factor NusB [Solobacterium sp.]|nr:transcription antitermination factor NusB [Solobacterium sp.]